MTAPVSMADFQSDIAKTVGDTVKGLVDPVTAKMAELERQLTELRSHNPDPALKDAARGTNRAPGTISRRTKMDDENDKIPGITVGRVARSLAACAGDHDRALGWARQRWGTDDRTCRAIESLQVRTPDGSVNKDPQLISDFEAGGSFLGPEFSSDWVNTLRPFSVVRDFGPRLVDMPGSASWVMPKVTASTSAFWMGESQPATKTGVTTGQLTASARKNGAILPMSREMVRFGGPTIDAMLTEDLALSMALLQDLSFIRGLPGLVHSPRGIRYWAVAANVLTVTGGAATTAPTLTQLNTDINKMKLQLRTQNAPMRNVGFIMSPRTEFVLQNARDSNGQLFFRGMDMGTLIGFPYKVTTQIPENLGAGSETEIYLVDFSEAIVTDFYGVEIAISDQASFVDGSTTFHSFQRDLVVIRALSAVDFTMRHGESAVVQTTCTWATPPLGG